MAILALLLALAAPLLLLPVEKYLPYPYILEEAVKLLLLICLVGDKTVPKRQLWWWAAGIGVSFAVSETALYAANFLWLGTAAQLGLRLAATGFLHVGTVLAMLAAIRFGGRLGWLWGFLIAALWHWLTNASLAWYLVR